MQVDNEHVNDGRDYGDDHHSGSCMHERDLVAGNLQSIAFVRANWKRGVQTHVHTQGSIGKARRRED